LVHDYVLTPYMSNHGGLYVYLYMWIYIYIYIYMLKGTTPTPLTGSEMSLYESTEILLTEEDSDNSHSHFDL